MTPRGAGWIAAAAVTSVISGITVNQISGDSLARWAWLGLAVVATAAATVSEARWNRSAGEDAPDDPAIASERALNGLAEAVLRVWEDEERHRRLLNPRPLPVAWTTIGSPVADHWVNTRADGVNEPLDLDGVIDDASPAALRQIVTDPQLRGRVVLLGEPGGGKTAVLLRLTLQLLRLRQAADRVPVFLRLSTWNPDEQTFDRWIAERVRVDYGYHRPVSAGGLLPILDGLDEMPPGRRRRALLAISNTFTPDAPLVLSSRTTEYLDALTALAGNVLAAATVLELTPLHPDAIGSYLALTTARPDLWTNALARDKVEHRGRLAAALSAPLWVDLARTTYTDPNQPDYDPAELLNLPDLEAIHRRLLDQLVATAYPDPPEPGPDGRIWRRDAADRWLRYLATQMRHRGTQDLAWWELIHAVPRRFRSTAAIGAALAAGLALGLTVGPTAGMSSGLAIGIAAGLGLGFDKPPAPARRTIRLRRTGQPLLRRLARVLLFYLGGTLAFGLSIGLVGGLAAAVAVRLLAGVAIGIMWCLGVGLAVGLVVGLAGGLAFGLSIGLVFEFTTWSKDRDTDVTVASDPLAVLRDDRRRGFADAPALGLTIGLALGSAAYLNLGLVNGLKIDVAAGLACIAWWLAYIAYGRFLLARVWLAGTDQLPPRLMSFLADAHRRGVLRQAGGVYQFRHALLRDRLSETTHETLVASTDA